MHLTATCVIEIVLCTTSTRWKMLGTWIFLSEWVSLMTWIPFLFPLVLAVRCNSLHGQGDGDAEQLCVDRWASGSQGQEPCTARWVSPWWLLMGNHPLLCSNTAGHLLLPRHLRCETAEWTWLEVRVLSQRNENVRVRKKGLFISTVTGSVITTVQAEAKQA